MATQGGTAAQWTTVPSGLAVPLPDTASFALGATLGVAGLTAAAALQSIASLDGITVLVHGGSGAVGSLCIVMAQEAGAHVLATAGTDQTRGRAVRLGAAACADYRSDHAAAELLHHAPSGFDLIIDVALDENIHLSAAVVADGGTIVSYQQPRRAIEFPRMLALRNTVLRSLLIFTLPQPTLDRGVARISELLAAGALPVPDVIEFPLDEIEDAHRAVRDGTGGARVLVIPPPL